MKFANTGGALLAMVLMWGASANAQEETDKQEKEVTEVKTRNCVGTRRIRSVKVVDDRNVLIFLSGSSVLHNVLEDSCRGLKALNNFSYTTTDGQLCKGDGIAPMDDPWGTLRPVPRCWLGVHRQITRDQAKIMLGEVSEEPEVRPLELPMPEPAEVGVDEEKEPGR